MLRTGFGLDRALGHRRRPDDRTLTGLDRVVGHPLEVEDARGELLAHRAGDPRGLLGVAVRDEDVDEDGVERHVGGDPRAQLVGGDRQAEVLDDRVEHLGRGDQVRVGLHALLGEGVALEQLGGVLTTRRGHEQLGAGLVGLGAPQREQCSQGHHQQCHGSDGAPALAHDPVVVVKVHGPAFTVWARSMSGPVGFDWLPSAHSVPQRPEPGPRAPARRAAEGCHDVGHGSPEGPVATGTLITVAPTGAELAKSDFPQLPTTLDELVETAVSCEAAGASMIHLHIRDGEHRPTLDQGYLKAAVDALREQTVPGHPAVDGRQRARPPRPAAHRPGRRTRLLLPHLRHHQLRRRRLPQPVRFMSDLYVQAQEREVVPEFELFDLGHVTSLARLIDTHGLPFGGKVHVDFVTGVPGGMPGTPAALLAGVAMLPPEVTSWSATGIGRTHLPDRGGGVVGRRTPAGGHGGQRRLRPRHPGRAQLPAGRAGGAPRRGHAAPGAVHRRRPPDARRQGPRLTPPSAIPLTPGRMCAV